MDIIYYLSVTNDNLFRYSNIILSVTPLVLHMSMSKDDDINKFGIFFRKKNKISGLKIFTLSYINIHEAKMDWTLLWGFFLSLCKYLS